MQPADEAKEEFCRLNLADLEAIMVIEESVYAHPWTRGNFLDSFVNAYPTIGMRNAEGELMAYFVAMPVFDELHLLTIAVDRKYQRQGYAKKMLHRMLAMSLEMRLNSVLLEVRVSNSPAIGLYQSFGFSEIGRRKAYYPAENGAREDAIVMRLLNDEQTCA